MTIWPFSVSFLLFATLAFTAPFLVLYYQQLQFTGPQIGLLVGLPPLITLLTTPLWTGWADTSKRHHLVVSLAILGSASALVALPLVSGFLPVLLLVLLFILSYSPLTSFADSATMFMLADKKALYGRIRLGGTIGFGLAAPLAGLLVQTNGLKFAFWGGAVLLLLALLVSQKLIHGQLSADPAARTGFRALLINPQWYFFLILAFMGGVAMSATNNYLFPFLQELRANESTMGLVLTFGTFSEIPVLFFGNYLLKRFKPFGLLRWAMLITGIRLIFFAFSGSANHILFLQLFGGLTFPAMWLAGVAYADEHAPVGLRTTAQGLFGVMVGGFGASVGGFVGGALLASLGGRGIFFLYGAIVLGATLMVSFQQKRTLSSQTLSGATGSDGVN